MKTFDSADTHKGLGTPRAHTLRTTGLAGSPLQDPHRSPSLVSLAMGPLLSLFRLSHPAQDPLQLVFLLILAAAFWLFQLLRSVCKLFSYWDIRCFPGRPCTSPPVSWVSVSVEACHVRGRRVGRSRELYRQKDPLGRGEKPLETPTLGPE